MQSRVGTFLVLVATAPAASEGVWAQEPICTRISSNGRLPAGTSFTAVLHGGLQFRLKNDWRITVVPTADTSIDYLWLVSPPLRFAPHHSIGPAYGMSARESVALPRDLRFVVSAEDYRAARIVIDSSVSGDVLGELEVLGKGRLSLVVTAYGLRGERHRDGTLSESLDWIAFEGEACVPNRQRESNPSSGTT